MGRGGGQVVSVRSFSSEDPSSNPAKAYSFFVKIVFGKNKKEAGVGLLNKAKCRYSLFYKVYSTLQYIYVAMIAC